MTNEEIKKLVHEAYFEAHADGQDYVYLNYGEKHTVDDQWESSFIKRKIDVLLNRDK